MRKKYLKPLCTVIHTEMDVAILQDSNIPLKPNDPIFNIEEKKREDDGEECGRLAEELDAPPKYYILSKQHIIKTT